MELQEAAAWPWLPLAGTRQILRSQSQAGSWLLLRGSGAVLGTAHTGAMGCLESAQEERKAKSSPGLLPCLTIAALLPPALELLAMVSSVCSTLGTGGGSRAAPQAPAQGSVLQARHFCQGNRGQREALTASQGTSARASASHSSGTKRLQSWSSALSHSKGVKCRGLCRNIQGHQASLLGALWGTASTVQCSSELLAERDYGHVPEACS